MLIAVNYHYIREQFDDPYPSIFGVTPKAFSEQLDLLGQKARFVSLEELLDSIDKKQALPAVSAVITFDDGLREQYETALPILRRKGIPAIFFTNTQPVDERRVTATHKIHILRATVNPVTLLDVLTTILEQKEFSLELPSPAVATAVYRYDAPEAARIKYFLNYSLPHERKEQVLDACFETLGFDETAIVSDLYMTAQMLTALAESDFLGTHGHAHLPLGLLDQKAAFDDIETSLLLLKQWTGFTMRALSYPFGFHESCSTPVADYARTRGVQLAFTMERAANANLEQPMFLGRFAPNDVFATDNRRFLANFWERITPARWFR